MRRFKDKYVAESLRAIGLAAFVTGLFRDDPAQSRVLLAVTGVLLIVFGWVFAKPDDPDK